MPKNYSKEDLLLNEKERRNLSILETIRRFGPISRPAISENLGLNVVTISHYVDNFLRKNLVVETSLAVSEGGRRPLLLDLNPQGGYTIGIGVNLLNIVALLIDAKGNILQKVQLDVDINSPSDILGKILDITRKIIQRSKEYVDRIKGIGLAVAGLVNKHNGTVCWPQRTSPKEYNYISVDIPLAEMLEKEFGLPVLVDNDATCACFGENWFDKERHWENVLYMFSGVGCGMILNGKLYRGSLGYAGEVFIHNYKEMNLFQCNLGNSCFLKCWEYDLGILEEIKKRLSIEKDVGQQILDLAQNKIENISLRTVFNAYRIKNLLAEEVVNKAAQRLGIKAAFLVNFLNPEVLILGGGVEEAGNEFLKVFIRALRDWAFYVNTENLKIIYSKLRENACAYGAAALMMENFFANI